MKIYLVASILSLVGSCATIRHSDRIQQLKDSVKFQDEESIREYANSITSDELKDHVYTISDDEFQGREVGQPGHQKVVDYLVNYYKKENINSSVTDNSYLQTIPKNYLGDGIDKSDNVIAFIEGSEYPDEVVILSAHSDHIGIENDIIYNGADDNGSGTSAILEIAQAFHIAKLNGQGPKRSIAFLHLTGEEIGLSGSNYFIKNPLFPLENAVANLNIDMIGRVDELHKDNPNYIYVIGADRLSNELHFISEKANSIFTDLELDYKYNAENEPNRYYYRSDHYNFARNEIPVIFYFNGEHPDYHEATDTAEKLNYKLLEKRSKLIFTTAWYLANSNTRIEVDKIR